MDSRPLPELGLATQPRAIIFGFVSNGWMAYDGRWKLCKYATGEQHLFDLASDPDEQINRINDPAAFRELRRLDDALTREVMRSVSPQLSRAKGRYNGHVARRKLWQRRLAAPLSTRLCFDEMSCNRNCELKNAQRK